MPLTRRQVLSPLDRFRQQRPCESRLSAPVGEPLLRSGLDIDQLAVHELAVGAGDEPEQDDNVATVGQGFVADQARHPVPPGNVAYDDTLPALGQIAVSNGA
jgi:hypothetical protein